MKNRYKRDYLEEAKKLPTLFREIQDIRYGRAIPKQMELKPKKNVKLAVDKRFNIAGAVIGVSFLILFTTAIQSNSIFATTEKQKNAISEFEKNENKIDIMNVLSSNISELTQKEMEIIEVFTDFETRFIESDLLPKGEENIIQNGDYGKLERTIIKTFINNELIDENIISEIEVDKPIDQIIEIGTSEFLYENKVHIGDKMYTTEEVELYTEPNSSNLICKVYQYIDITLLSEKNGWAKISVDGIEGYIKSNKITSENVTPGIAELSRKARILLGVDFNMAVNVPSGLEREDFVKIFSNCSRDTNNIFKENAEFFYEMEQKYKVNGLFLASIGIHESNWGTSYISLQKRNLFGYGSYDDSAFESSYDFESYKNGIETVAKALAKYYLNVPGTFICEEEIATGTYYNGSTISSVNIRYASDLEWANKVYNIMVSLYQKL